MTFKYRTFDTSCQGSQRLHGIHHTLWQPHLPQCPSLSGSSWSSLSTFHPSGENSAGDISVPEAPFKKLNVEVVPCQLQAKQYVRDAEERASLYAGQNDRMVIHICCDASFARKSGEVLGSGCVAVVTTIYTYTPNCSKSTATKVCRIAKAEDNNECEIIAILESLFFAAEQIQKYRQISSSPTEIELIIWSDSRTALNRLGYCGHKQTRFLTRTTKLYNLIVYKTREIETMGRSVEVRFRWVKGRSVGNHDVADKFSKLSIDLKAGSKSSALAALQNSSISTAVEKYFEKSSDAQRVT